MSLFYFHLTEKALVLEQFFSYSAIYPCVEWLRGDEVWFDSVVSAQFAWMQSYKRCKPVEKSGPGLVVSWLEAFLESKVNSYH